MIRTCQSKKKKNDVAATFRLHSAQCKIALTKVITIQRLLLSALPQIQVIKFELEKHLSKQFFHFKNPRLGFSFLPPVSFEIIKCRFFQSDFLLSSYPTILVQKHLRWSLFLIKLIKRFQQPDDFQNFAFVVLLIHSFVLLLQAVTLP